MTQQSEALRHADKLDAHEFDEPHGAAAELRRLHDLAMEQQGKIYALEMARSMEQKTAKLKRDALLAALRPFAAINASVGFTYKDVDRARAAIKAVEEGK